MSKHEDEKKAAEAYAIDKMIQAASGTTSADLPKLRTFRVALWGAEDQYIDAHSVQIIDGTLAFHVGVIIDGHVVTRSRRGFASGVWKDYEEVFIGQSSERAN